MAERPAEVFDEFSRHLRFLQLTLVASCVGFVTILLSDRQSMISRADKQINDIYNYTLPTNWDEGGVQRYLDDGDESQSLSEESFALIDGELKTYLLDGEGGKVQFEFEYHARYLKDLRHPDNINFDGEIHCPTTLSEFREFFNNLTSADGVYAIKGVKGPVVHRQGYRHNDPPMNAKPNRKFLSKSCPSHLLNRSNAATKFTKRAWKIIAIWY